MGDHGQPQLLPNPNAPFVIGIRSGDDLIHAVRQDAARGDGDSHCRHVASACGGSVLIARRWGVFQRGNDRTSCHRLCPHCAWIVALDQNATDAELAATAPTGAEIAAMRRLGNEPMLLVRICEQILADARAERDYDLDSPRWAQLLGHATAHRPEILVSEECAEGSCEHRTPDACYDASTTVACPTCSVRAGSWAGEWEGQYECPVSAPCAVLAAMYERYCGVKITGARS